MTRVGKIARLPREVREQLNIRIRNGEKGSLLVKWLNSLPEVQAVAREEFGGKCIRDPNLSLWKSGGYQDWLREQEALAEVQRAMAGGNRLSGAAQRGLADHLAFWITARYMVATRKLDSGNAGEINFKVLRAVCKDLVALRRGEFNAVRIEMGRKKIEKMMGET